MKMKLSLSLIIILVLSLLLVACDTPAIEEQFKFLGTVTEITDDYILVKTTDEEIGSDVAKVSLLKLEHKGVYSLKDIVEIYYDGTVKESHPLQIDALSIININQNGIDNEHVQEPKKANIDNFINEFAYKTSEHLLVNGNVNYSPMSLYLALSLANSGANGDTQEEITTLLGLPQNMIEEFVDKLLDELQKNEEDSKFWLANSLWIEEELDGKKIEFEKDFLGIAKENFNSQIFSMDFGSTLTGKEMGKWVNENTKGILSPEFTTEKGQLATIINTVYFKDKWNSSFVEEYTKEAEFTKLDGSRKIIDFMNQSTNSNYVKTEEFKKASLGLQGGGSMFFVLPDENVNIEALLRQDKLREVIELETEHTKVNWSIPKFIIDSEFKLIPTLKKLGVEKAFGDQADFSKMIKDIDIFISDIAQGTHIKVEEGGVEAAAYTAITFNTTSMDIEEPKEMILDRPFIYVISDENDNILFIGTYVE